MPTSKTRLSARIEAIMDDYDNITPQELPLKRKDFADKMADAIVDEIKELQISYTSGLANGAGPVTGQIIHTVL